MQKWLVSRLSPPGYLHGYKFSLWELFCEVNMLVYTESLEVSNRVHWIGNPPGYNRNITSVSPRYYTISAGRCKLPSSSSDGSLGSLVHLVPLFWTLALVSLVSPYVTAPVEVVAQFHFDLRCRNKSETQAIISRSQSMNALKKVIFIILADFSYFEHAFHWNENFIVSFLESAWFSSRNIIFISYLCVQNSWKVQYLLNPPKKLVKTIFLGGRIEPVKYDYKSQNH